MMSINFVRNYHSDVTNTFTCVCVYVSLSTFIRCPEFADDWESLSSVSLSCFIFMGRLACDKAPKLGEKKIPTNIIYT
jgi:hypothetical protein